MMAACQPFLSGAISKTVNLPETATVEEIKDVYFQGWKLGLKALAVYRDNCKVGQPLSDGKEAKSSGSTEVKEVIREVIVEKPIRRRLPKSRQAITTSFSVGGAEGYMTSGAHEDGSLGEIFMKLGKQGSTLAGMMDAFSIAISISLQYGVPLETFVSKFTNMKFEPAGLTDDPDVRMSQSIMDYTFRRLALDYLDFDTRAALGIHSADERQRYLDTGSHQPISSGSTAAELIDEPSSPVAPVETVKATESVDTSKAGSVSVSGDSHEAAASKPAPKTAHTSAELFEQITGSAVDSPLCMTCGTKMRPAGSCHVCEGCGSTSGCS
jgi:ribonucleoside-diphosphate reductase alpha chain